METNSQHTAPSLTASGAPYQPSRSTLAARSLAAVERIPDSEQRRAAFARHMSEFPPTIGRVRPV
ncbi:hypothetical protein [Agromyces arachidis]|uniref:hypothetical protein n=1 Tax=Agromyces arachidis TaxID=766966 RepID=UPI004056CFAD